MSIQIQIRRDTAANWTSVNPTLANGELGIESDSGRFKIGTGVTAWNGLGYAYTPVVITTQQAAGHTFALTDGGTVVEGTNASGQTFTIPTNASVAFPLGTIIEVFQDGAGQITIAGAGGVTVRTPGGSTTAVRYSTIALRKRATDEWVLSGDLG